ncbi:MAG: EAL domain-containing protein [Nitrosomonadales bacterium]|nr:EAL domain-containing protein [Nitrosomonadales bacterium]
MKISTRLVLSFMLAAVLPLALFSYFNLQQDEATLRTEALGRMSDLADKKTMQVKSYLAERLQDAAFLARTPEVMEGLANLSREYPRRNAAGYIRENDGLHRYFSRYVEERALFHDMLLINPQGEIVYSQKHEADFATNLSSGPWRGSQLARAFRDACMTLEPVFSGYESYQPSSAPAVFIAVPVMVGGKFKGVIAAQLDNRLFYQVATDATGLGVSGEAAFAQWDGEEMLYTTPLKYQADAAMRLRIGQQEARPTPMFGALSGNSGAGVNPDYRGTQVVAAWRYLPELDWGMVVKIDADEVFASIYRQRSLMQSVLFGLLLFSGLLGYLFARQFSVPLRGLAQTADALAQGNMGVRADESATGELGLFARTFNRMADKLQELHRTQEARIEQRTAELAQRVQELRVKDEAIASSINAIALAGLDGKIFYVNRAFVELWRLPAPEDAIGRSPAEFWDEPQQARAVMEALQQQGRWRGELTAHLHDGTLAVMQLSGCMVRDEHGEPMCMMGSFVDVTERKRIELALQGERDFAKHLLEAAPVIILLLDTRGAIQHVNPYFEQLTGYRVGEVTGKEWLATFLPERDRDHVCTLLQAVLNEARMSGNVSHIVTRSGAERKIEWNTQPMRDAQGKVTGMLCIGQDVTERVTNENLLRISAERLNEAQRIARVGSWELDLVRGALSWTDEIFRLFEIDQGKFSATYEAFLNAIHPDDRDMVNEAYTHSLETRAPYEIEHRLLMSDGRIKWVEERCSSEFDDDGKPLRSVGTVQDITERKRYEAELMRFNEELEHRVAQRTALLQAAKEEAEVASRSKSLFLTSMSHELRTPLNAILGYAQLMQLDSDLPAHVIENAREIRSAGDYLLVLLNDVLDLARIESGRMEIQVESFRLSEVLAQCHAQNSQAARARNIALVDQRGCDATDVVADRRRTLQVLNNLVSNAIKYNREGGSVRISCGAGMEGRIRIAVTDTGAGIAPSLQAQLFQPFNRLGAEMGKIQGTGVGLAISRRLIEAMDGSIGVDSVQGEGSTFWVELPTERRAVARHEQMPQRAAPNKVPRVLVAEDYAPNQNLLRVQLQALGCEVELASDGAEALSKYRTGRYDLVLTDLNMPKMDGTALAMAIREDEAIRGGHVPIVAITAAAVSSELKRCRAAGMDDTLTKPLALDKLRDTLSRWLGAAVAQAAFDQEQAAKEGGDAVLNLDHLYRAIGHANFGEARSLLDTFISSAAKGLAQLDKQPGDLVAVSHEMHRQKSSALTMGALHYAQLADDLEWRSKGGDVAGLAGGLAALRDALGQIKLAVEHLQEDGETGLPREMDAAVINHRSALVVDDDPVVLQQITSLLGRLGMTKVLVAGNGAEAIRVLAECAGKVEVLFCDLNMPEMDGVELIREFGRRGFDGGVILISGEDEKVLSTVGRLAELQGLRVLGQLCKPLTPAQIVPILNHPATRRRVQRPALVLPAVSPDAIRAGMAGNEFAIWFQPKVDSSGLRALGVEALARWRQRDGRFISPEIFITVAEQEGVIGELSQHLLALALTEGARLFEAGFPLEIAVNLSGRWLSDLNLPDFILKQTLAAHLKVDHVMLEVTETGVMEDLTTALDVLTRLRLKGFGLSIDDFGIGYSSFEQLSRIPFTEMKLDRSFVSMANHDRAARAILEGSMDMARKLGLSTVAEGVETEQDLELVRTLGCERVQGYLIARPMPVEELIDWLRSEKNTGMES